MACSDSRGKDADFHLADKVIHAGWSSGWGKVATASGEPEASGPEKWFPISHDIQELSVPVVPPYNKKSVAFILEKLLIICGWKMNQWS